MSSGQFIIEVMEFITTADANVREVVVLQDLGDVVVCKVTDQSDKSHVVKATLGGLDDAVNPLPKAISNPVMQTYASQRISLIRDDTEFPTLLETLPYYAGKNYRQALQQSPTSTEKFNWALHWLFIVRSLHALGIVHLDLKPENIMQAEVGTDTHAVLIDFETALLLSPGQVARRKLTSSLGTPFYIAPEASSLNCYS